MADNSFMRTVMNKLCVFGVCGWMDAQMVECAKIVKSFVTEC